MKARCRCPHQIQAMSGNNFVYMIAHQQKKGMDLRFFAISNTVSLEPVVQQVGET